MCVSAGFPWKTLLRAHTRSCLQNLCISAADLYPLHQITGRTMSIHFPNNSSISAPLSAVDKKSYAYNTVQTRMPIILTKVVDHLSRHKSEVYEGKDSANPLETCNKSLTGHEAQEAWRIHRQEIEEELKMVVGALSKLRNELETNKLITLFTVSEAGSDCGNVSADNYTDDLAEWNRAYESPLAKNLLSATDKPKWFESAWLYVECYMYRRIMLALQQTKHLNTLDPFKWQKAESLKDSTENVHAMLDYLNNTVEKLPKTTERFADNVKQQFEKLLRLSLWGNKGDLSHNAGKEKSNNTDSQTPHEVQDNMRNALIIDDSDAIWEHLKQKSKTPPVRVDIVCDNYGFELITDLIFGEFLIVSKLANQVCYHVKKMPWFVSDTTESDFYRTLDVLNEHSGKFGDKWRKYLEEGVFVVTSDPFWTLPYDFDWMQEKAPKLYSYLQESSLIIFKGDLNYRKLAGDRSWPPTTPFRTALRSFLPAPLCTLRGLKAEVVVGLREGQAEELAVIEENWMTSGEFAVIQFICPR